MAGIDHNLADIDVRSGFSFTKKQAAAALNDLKSRPGIAGAVILNTCSRTEVWADINEDMADTLPGMVCGLKGMSPDKYLPYIVTRKDGEAVSHLFALAAGLKSQILAEDQILTQVGDAIALSRENLAANNVLEVLFRDAQKAAKRVKSTVAFDRSDKSAVDSAIKLLSDAGINISGTKCLVIGNGRMGRVTSQTLLESGALVTVTVREYHSGVVDIPRGCIRINYSERLNVLKEFPVIFSATASPNYTLTLDEIKQAAPNPGTYFIDLAVPRDIDPSVGSLKGIKLYNIDNFKTGKITEAMDASIHAAEKILKEEEAEFYSWYSGKDLIPAIGQIKQNAALDLDGRLQKVIRKLPISKDEQEDLAKSIDTSMSKVITKLIFGMRDNLDKDTFIACVEALQQIYNE